MVVAGTEYYLRSRRRISEDEEAGLACQSKSALDLPQSAVGADGRLGQDKSTAAPT